MKSLGFVVSVVIMLSILLSSCSTFEFQFDPERLMMPPMTSEEQLEIHDALKKDVGGEKKITLKYPKKGEYRSAIVQYDIDNDGMDEAVAFYTYNENGRPVKVRTSILDKIDEKWQVVYTEAGENFDVDFISFANVTSKTGNIIIGYGNNNETGMKLNKVLKIYKYEDQKLQLVGKNAEQDYRKVIFIDRPGTDQKDVMTIYAVIGVMDYEVGIRLFRYDGGEFKQVNPFINSNKNGNLPAGERNGDAINITINCDDPDNIKSFTEYQDQETTLVFLDYSRSPYLATHVLAIKNDIFYEINLKDTASNLNLATYRQKGLYSQDIDNDGLIEVPINLPDDGVRITSDKLMVDNPLKYITWISVDSNKFKIKYNMIYNNVGSYGFVVPEQWLGKVQAQLSGNEREMIISTVDTDGTGTPTEILSIMYVPEMHSTTNYVPVDYEVLYKDENYSLHLKTSSESGIFINNVSGSIKPLTKDEVLKSVIRDIQIDTTYLEE